MVSAPLLEIMFTNTFRLNIGGEEMAQLVKHLPCKCRDMSSNPQDLHKARGGSKYL